MVVVSQEDSKFAHLLEPIRDLAANWDVNIADELEDYLVRSQGTRSAAHIRRCISGIISCSFSCGSPAGGAGSREILI